MKVLFIGSGTFGLPVLDAVAASRHELVGIVTAVDKPQGRGKIMTASPAKVWAEMRNIPVFTPLKINTPESITQLKAFGADVFLVASYGAILSRDVLALPPRGCINVHPSLLPKYRGASPVTQTLLNGDPKTGMTIMAMAAELDAGDILLQETIDVPANENVRELTDRLTGLGGRMTVEALDLIEAEKSRPVPQDPAAATFCKKLKKEDGRIDWAKPAVALHNQIRALMIWPGSFSTRRGKIIKIIRARTSGAPVPPGVPGEVIDTRSPEGLLVRCGDQRALALEELQPEGGRAMSWKDFLNGSSIKVGDTFE